MNRRPRSPWPNPWPTIIGGLVLRCRFLDRLARRRAELEAPPAGHRRIGIDARPEHGRMDPRGWRS